MRTIIMAAALAAGTASLSAPAIAQVGGGLVVVNISNVANNIARDLSVDVQDVIDIGSVQVPIGIAANVCPEVNANVLAEQRKSGGGASCTAENTSQALNQIVQRQLNAQ